MTVMPGENTTPALRHMRTNIDRIRVLVNMRFGVILAEYYHEYVFTRIEARDSIESLRKIIIRRTAQR